MKAAVDTSRAMREPRSPVLHGLGVIARWHRLLAVAAVLGLLVLAVSLLEQDGFYAALLVQMLVFAIAAMGLDFLGGYGGLVSLGQAGYVGLGAYGVAIGEQHGMGPWTAVAVSLLVVLAVGLITGPLAIRVSGIGFVIITLAMGQIMWGLASRWASLSGGDNGLAILSAPVIGPIDLNDLRTQSLAVLVVFVIAALVLRIFVSSPFGLSLRGIRSNEQRLRTLGYATGLHRYIGYVVSVFFGGVAGVLFAFTNGLISPVAMDFSHNGLITLMAVLGGLGTLWGPALGSVIILGFEQWLSIYFSRWATAMGIVFVVIVLFAPEGVWGLLQRAGRWFVSLSSARPGETAAAMQPAESPPSADAQSSVDGPVETAKARP